MRNGNGDELRREYKEIVFNETNRHCILLINICILNKMFCYLPFNTTENKQPPCFCLPCCLWVTRLAPRNDWGKYKPLRQGTTPCLYPSVSVLFCIFLIKGHRLFLFMLLDLLGYCALFE